MALKPDVSLTVSLATGAVVWAVYMNALPTLPDVRSEKANDPEIDGSRKAAAWTSAGVVGAISLIAKDPTVFILGGAMVVVADWWYRHANARSPEIGGILPTGARVALQEDDPDPALMSGVA